jgi:DNA-binding response OmpR family regulator
LLGNRNASWWVEAEFGGCVESTSIGRGLAGNHAFATSRLVGSLPALSRHRRALLALSDPAYVGFVALAIEAHGIMPTLCFTLDHARSCLAEMLHDVAVIDLKLCSEDREAVARSLHPLGDTPLLWVGGDRLDRAVPGSADGVQRVPDSAPASELADRAAALADSHHSRPPPALRWGPLELDTRRRTTSWGGARLDLTPTQFRILALLVQARGAVVMANELSRLVYGVPAQIGDAERVFAHIRRIRKKIEPTPSRPAFLLTVRGEGFRLADPPLTTS